MSPVLLGLIAVRSIRRPGRWAAEKPTSTVGEFDGHVWNPRLARCAEPLQENDHGMDARRYLVAYLDAGPKPDTNFSDEPLAYREPTRW